MFHTDVKASLTEIHGKEVALAKGRWTQMMKRRLEAVPEHRRAIAEEKLERLISRSYQEGEKEERITILINLVLAAHSSRNGRILDRLPGD